MRLHRMSLAHAQDITGRLLEAIVEAVPRLRLIEIEGDAGFFSSSNVARQGSTADAALAFSREMHRAFHEQQQWLVAHNMCSCDGCLQAGELKVKFVAHV